jgi:hypothetical protein
MAGPIHLDVEEGGSMKAPRVVVAVVLALLVPTQAMAAVCLNVSGFGDAQFEISSIAGGFFGLIGVMRRTDCGPVTPPQDRTAFTGTAYVNTAGNVHVGLLVTGSPVCYPITVWGDLPLSLSGPGHVDLPSGGLASFTNVTISPVGCFPLESAGPAASSEGLNKSGSQP